MKLPCEIVVWRILPMIRKELAKELVSEYGLTQSAVAQKFGITDAAISQYLKEKRGENSDIEQSDKYAVFKEAIRASASDLAADRSEFQTEMCKLCVAVKKSGLLEEIYEKEVGGTPPSCVHL